jgi:hypothetical protein
MGSQSRTSNGGDERYERIATAANEVAQVVIALAQGAPTPLDLVVQNITTLIDDAVALSASTPSSPSPQPAPVPTRRDATTLPSPSLAIALKHVAHLDDQIGTGESRLGDAIGDAKHLCSELALAVRHGGPDLALLYALAAALKRVSTCSQTLGQLVHERTAAVSSLDDLSQISHPVDDFRVVGPAGRATRNALGSPTGVMSFVSPPAPASPEVDDGLRRGPRISGPSAF